MVKPKISVLIPVYNAQKYLAASLISVQQQTFKDFEIVCVDDGSTDDSLRILKEFSAADTRFKLFVQPNSGVAVTRNRLLQEASGEYVAFIDADDLVLPTYLEQLYAAAQQQQADISKCFFKEINAVGELTKAHCAGLFYKQPGDSARERFICGYYDAVVWGKLFRLDMLRRAKVSFLPGHVAEDFPFVILAFMLAKVIAYVKEPLYLYRKGNNTAITSNDRRMAVGILHNLLNLQQQLQRRNLFMKGVVTYWIKAVVWGVCRFRKFPQQIRCQQEDLQKKVWQQARQSVALCGFWQGLRWRMLFKLVDIFGWKSVYRWSKCFR